MFIFFSSSDQLDPNCWYCRYIVKSGYSKRQTTLLPIGCEQASIYNDFFITKFCANFRKSGRMQCLKIIYCIIQQNLGVHTCPNCQIILLLNKQFLQSFFCSQTVKVPSPNQRNKQTQKILFLFDANLTHCRVDCQYKFQRKYILVQDLKNTQF